MQICYHFIIDKQTSADANKKKTLQNTFFTTFWSFCFKISSVAVQLGFGLFFSLTEREE